MYYHINTSNQLSHTHTLTHSHSHSHYTTIRSHNQYTLATHAYAHKHTSIQSYIHTLTFAHSHIHAIACA